MNVLLWILQGLLAMMFLMAGMMKVFQSKEKLSARMAWANDVAEGRIKQIGIL